MDLPATAPIYAWADAVSYVWQISGTDTFAQSRLVGVPVCPDLLRYEDIGAADNLRGRVIRAFFWLLRWWPS